MTRTFRIVSGLVLFSFATLHLSNLAIGVVSIEMAEASRPWIMAPFSNFIGGPILMLSLLGHMLLGLASLYHRNTLRMTTQDAVQFITALAIPPLMIPHVWGVMGAAELLGIQATFPGLFKLFWIDAPLEGLRQTLVVVTVWIHGCIGLFTWLRLKSWWSRVSSFIYPLAVIIPVLAMLGFVEGGNMALEQARIAFETAQQAPIAETTQAPVSEESGPSNFAENYALLLRIKWALIYGYLAMVGAVFVARYFRLRSKDQTIEIQYADGTRIKTAVGPTLLEISNINDIPHANLCRGRGRCGTCRVRIIEYDGELAPPSDIEQKTLTRTGSGADVRLACQLVPGAGTLRIERIMSADIRPDDLHQKPAVAVETPDEVIAKPNIEGAVT